MMGFMVLVHKNLDVLKGHVGRIIGMMPCCFVAINVCYTDNQEQGIKTSCNPQCRRHVLLNFPMSGRRSLYSSVRNLKMCQQHDKCYQIVAN